MKHKLTRRQLEDKLNCLVVDAIYYHKDDALKKLIDIANFSGRLGFYKLAKEYTEIYEELRKDLENYDELKER